MEHISSSHYRAKPAVFPQVVVDALAANATGPGHRIVSLRIEPVHVTAPIQICERKSSARKKLVQEPQPSSVLSGRFGPDVIEEVLLFNLPKQGGEYAESDAVVFERELEMVSQRITGPVPGGIDFFD